MVLLDVAHLPLRQLSYPCTSLTPYEELVLQQHWLFYILLALKFHCVFWPGRFGLYFMRSLGCSFISTRHFVDECTHVSVVLTRNVQEWHYMKSQQ